MNDTLENRTLLNIDNQVNESSTIDLQSESIESQDTSSKWVHEAILLLLTLYENNLEAFKSGKKTNKSIWTNIARQMEKDGYHFVGEQCGIKFRNLKNTYKRIKDNNKQTGRGTISWPFYDRFDKIFGKSPDVNPISTASNSTGYSCSPSTSTASTSDDSAELNCGTSITPRKRRRIQTPLESEAEPVWLKQFKKEASERHTQKMSLLKELISILKNDPL